MTLRMIACLGLVALLPTWCFAQDRGSAEDQEACTPDVFRLCAAEMPDEMRIVACLKAKTSGLSPACREVIGPPTSRAKRRVGAEG